MARLIERHPRRRHGRRTLGDGRASRQHPPGAENESDCQSADDADGNGGVATHAKAVDRFAAVFAHSALPVLVPEPAPA